MIVEGYAVMFANAGDLRHQFARCIIAIALSLTRLSLRGPFACSCNSINARHSLRQVVAGFRRGLSESGYVEGQNVSVEYRWAGGEYAKLSEIVAELVSRPVAVLVAGADAAALAAKSATSSIPIVFSVGTDPVKLGLVAAFNRPSGNATGMTWKWSLVSRKGLLKRQQWRERMQNKRLECQTRNLSIPELSF
jgi:ABC-type uncharacterized transport system substrate-binding protein